MTKYSITFHESTRTVPDGHLYVFHRSNTMGTYSFIKGDSNSPNIKVGSGVAISFGPVENFIIPPSEPATGVAQSEHSTFIRYKEGIQWFDTDAGTTYANWQDLVSKVPDVTPLIKEPQ